MIFSNALKTLATFKPIYRDGAAHCANFMTKRIKLINANNNGEKSDAVIIVESNDKQTVWSFNSLKKAIRFSVS